jgi:hypothetical protein
VPFDDDQSVPSLWRALGRLEESTASMARLMELEQQQAREHRHEVREQIQASNDRTEKVIESLTEQISSLAASANTNTKQHASQAGAWALSRWLFATVLSLATLSAGWLGGKRGAIEAPCGTKAAPPPVEHHHIDKSNPQR